MRPEFPNNPTNSQQTSPPAETWDPSTEPTFLAPPTDPQQSQRQHSQPPLPPAYQHPDPLSQPALITTPQQETQLFRTEHYIPPRIAGFANWFVGQLTKLGRLEPGSPEQISLSGFFTHMEADGLAPEDILRVPKYQLIGMGVPNMFLNAMLGQLAMYLRSWEQVSRVYQETVLGGEIAAVV